MEFFRFRRTIPFMRHALAFNIASLVMFVLSVVFLATKGLHFSIEFTGGTVMEVNYAHAAEPEKIRNALQGIGLSDVTVQNFGTSSDILIRLPLKEVAGSSQNKEMDLQAKAVMDALIAKGIDKSRLSFKGWGATKPIGDNRTEDGKAKNRRVEIVKQ